MFDTLIDYINNTELTTLSREYYDGVDVINVLPLDNVLTDKEAQELNRLFDLSFKTKVEDLRSETQVDPNSPIYKHLDKVRLAIIKKFKFDCNYVDARLWHDEEGFYFYPHVDNEEVHISCQIYLDNNAPPWCGTSYFFHGKKRGDNFINILTPPYKLGSGYLLLNKSKEIHGMVHKVPEGSSRTSLYLNFKTK